MKEASREGLVRKTLFLLFPIAVVSALNCGGPAAEDGAESASDDLSSSKVRSLCTAFYSARADEFISCSPEGFASYYASTDDYVAQKVETCVAEYTSPAVNAKASTLKACFDAYGTMACPDFVKWNNESNPAIPAACAPLRAGKRADGASCAFHSECAGGECDKSGLCGVCATRHAAGDACTSDVSCAPGLACRTDEKCGAPSGAGAACGDSPDCEPGLFCNRGSCVAPLADGVACDSTTGWNSCDWTNGRVCDSTSGTCQMQAIHVTGESCGYELAAGNKFHLRGQCAPGLRCARNALRAYCVPETKVGEGCFFASGPDGAQCERDAACVDGVCVKRTAKACKDYVAPAPPTGPNPGALPVLRDQGGPTLHHAHLVTVTFPGYAYRDHARALDDYTVTSGYLSTVGADYGVSGADHLASIEVDEKPAGPFTNEDLQDFLVKKIDAGLLPKPPARFSRDDAYVYMVYVPADLVVSGPPFGKLCDFVYAYHDVVAYPYSFAYGVVGTCPADPGYSDLEMLDTAAPHELIEAMTDPGLNLSSAYLASFRDLWHETGGEVSDYCEGAYVEQGGFLMPRVWSNTAAVAGTDPCLPLEPGGLVYYNVTSDESFTGAAGATATLTIKGWSSGARADWQIVADAYDDGIGLAAGAITLDQATINAGGTATLSVAIPATAKSGQSTVVRVASRDPAIAGHRRHFWLVRVTVP